MPVTENTQTDKLLRVQLKVTHGDRELEVINEVTNANFEIRDQDFEALVSFLSQNNIVHLVNTMKTLDSSIIVVPEVAFE